MIPLVTHFLTGLDTHTVPTAFRNQLDQIIALSRRRGKTAEALEQYTWLIRDITNVRALADEIGLHDKQLHKNVLTLMKFHYDARASDSNDLDLELYNLLITLPANVLSAVRRITSKQSDVMQRCYEQFKSYTDFLQQLYDLKFPIGRND
jgi:hypothetical protein